MCTSGNTGHREHSGSSTVGRHGYRKGRWQVGIWSLLPSASVFSMTQKAEGGEAGARGLMVVSCAAREMKMGGGWGQWQDGKINCLWVLVGSELLEWGAE